MGMQARMEESLNGAIAHQMLRHNLRYIRYPHLAIPDAVRVDLHHRSCPALPQTSGWLHKGTHRQISCLQGGQHGIRTATQTGTILADDN